MIYAVTAKTEILYLDSAAEFPFVVSNYPEDKERLKNTIFNFDRNDCLRHLFRSILLSFSSNFSEFSLSNENETLFSYPNGVSKASTKVPMLRPNQFRHCFSVISRMHF